MIAPKGAHLPRPRIRDTQHAIRFNRCLNRRRCRVQHHRFHAKERQRRRPRLLWHGPRQRRDQMAAGFGLPERINNRAGALADMHVIPVPRLGVDRFPHRAQQFQTGKIVLFHPVRPLRHQRANGRGGGVELRHLMLGANLPEPPGIGECGHTFKHHGGGAIRQRAVNDIAVPGHPAHIGGAPEHIAIMVIKADLMRHRRVNQIPTAGVHHTLRLAGGA